MANRRRGVPSAGEEKEALEAIRAVAVRLQGSL